MRDKAYSFLLFAGILAILVPMASAQGFSGAGSGTEQDPYIIANIYQLQEMNVDLDAWYVLGNDIDASDTSNWNDSKGFIPIGSQTPCGPFLGNFNGKGHKITGLYISRSSSDSIGLFGVTSSGSVIKNVGLVNAGNRNGVGGLVGYNEFGTITNCYSIGNVSGNNGVGGLVGANIYGTITNCYSIGNVSGNGNVGGLVGYNYWSTITNSYATGSVSGGGAVGGLVGFNFGTITNCYATGSVTGQSCTGGLVGRNWMADITNSYATGTVSGWDYTGGLVGANDPAGITNSYATGSVTGSRYTGGLVGYIYGGFVTDSFWDTQTTGQSTSAGGLGKTTMEMKWQVTYTFASYPWDFETIWNIEEDVSYPLLRVFESDPTIPPPCQIAGSGTQEDPYIIANIKELQAMNNHLYAWYELGNDIDASATSGWPGGAGFIPIGSGSPYGDNAFRGHFDGKGHTITSLHINRPNSDYVGLFGCAPCNEIKDVGLINVDITGRDYVGGLIGHTGSGVSRTRCYTTGRVNGKVYVGGLIGLNWRTDITDCYSTASVSGDSTIGGLIGFACGYSGGTSTYVKISRCYSAGLVNDGVSGDYIGGLVGHSMQTDWNSCYWDIETSGQTTSLGGLGKTSMEMKWQVTFTFTPYPWDFENTWDIVEDLSYPYLRVFAEQETKPDLIVTDIKPIQTIQDIPLIKDKATMVRVFVDLLPTSIAELPDVTVELEFEGNKYYETATLIRYDGKLYVVPNQRLSNFKDYIKKSFSEDPQVRNQALDKLKWQIFLYGLDAFNFGDPTRSQYLQCTDGISCQYLLRPSGNEIIVSATIDPPDVSHLNGTFLETNEDNNRKVTDPPIKVKNIREYKILFQRLSENAKPEDFEVVQIEEAFLSFSKAQFDYLMATYPFSTNVKFDYWPELRKGSYRKSNKDLLVCPENYDMVVYIVPKNWMQEGGFSNKSFTDAVIVKEGQPGPLAAHEIGHTFGYCDEYEYGGWLGWNPLNPECGSDWDNETYPNGYVAGDGWDVLGVTGSKEARARISYSREEPTENRFNHFSFMGEGAYSSWAPSNFYAYNKYNTLLERLGISPDPRILHVRGLIYDDNSVELFPFHSYDSTPTILEPGTYTFECLSTGNEVLSKISFEPFFMSYSPTGEVVAPFSFRILYPEGTAKTILKHYESILEEVVVSLNRPRVRIVSINDLGNETYELIWDANDPDGDTLAYSAYYSHNGIDWYPLFLSLSNIPFRYVFETGDFPGSENATVKLVVTDGINTVEPISNPFSVSNKPPLAFISRPSNDSVFTRASDITFEGWAYDPEQFELNGASLVWVSDIDGIIGAGSLVTTSTLSVGAHNVTLTATDEHGSSGLDTVPIAVVPVGDINRNFSVDIFDLSELAHQWLETCEELSWCDGADLNKSGSVDFYDLAEFAEHWLEGI